MLSKTLMKLYWRPCRIASVFVIVLSLTMRLFGCGTVELQLFALDLATALGMLILVPMAMDLGLGTRNAILVLSLFEIFWILYDVFCERPSDELVYGVYLALSVLPLLIGTFLQTMSFWGKKALSLTKISGSEMLISYINAFESNLYVALVAIGVIVLGRMYRIVLVLATVLIALMYLIIMLRSLLKDYYLDDHSVFDGSGNRLKSALIFKRPDKANVADRALCKKLYSLMNDSQLFLRQDLKLEDIATELGTNRAYASRIINDCAGVKFNEFVNNYRINYAITLMKSDPKIKVSNLPFMTGFRNPVTFLNAFKLSTGYSPKEWVLRYWTDVQQNLIRRPGRPSV